jgi:hypothetical protein
MEVRNMVNKKVISLLAFGFLVMAVLSCEDEPPPPPEEIHYCNFLPTDLGNKWVYQVVEDSKFSPREEYKLTYEIKKTEQGYEGFPEAYVITVTRQGSPPYDVIAGPYDVTCYLERQMWPYLIANDIEIGGWTQTGLVNDFPLQYRRDVKITVPAGTFGDDERCAELYFDNENEVEPEYWLEDYALYYGLVYYENGYTKYDRATGNPIDWRRVTYELLDCKVPDRADQPPVDR